jgi:hypothetical protein
MYCMMHGPSCDATAPYLVIDAAFLDANEAVVKEHLQKAGIRLAQLLDMALPHQGKPEDPLRPQAL